MPFIECSSYSENIFHTDKFQNVVARTVVKVCQLHKLLQFDAIAIRGNSGAAVGWPVSYITGIPIVLIRKGEKTHGRDMEGPDSRIDRYLILDDFIETGTTVRSMIDEFSKRRVLGNSDCVGVLLYNAWSAVMTAYKEKVGVECYKISPRLTASTLAKLPENIRSKIALTN
jgi:orotate phosphoribosyltransferase